MKCVILAGGKGTRIAEESNTRPKPMVEIGSRPILWHIMKLYAHHGLSEFVICLGYKGYMIKEYFMNFVLHHSDVTIDAAKNSITTTPRCQFICIAVISFRPSPRNGPRPKTEMPPLKLKLCCPCARAPASKSAKPS